MEITEKWLGEIGGWQALKAARMLVAAGKVQIAEHTSSVIRGHIGGEKSRLESGLLIRSRSDVENLCTCLMARRSGQICEHSLAIGLASLAAMKEQKEGSQGATGSSKPQPVSPARPLEMATAPGQLSLFLPESLLQVGGTLGKSATAFLKSEAGEAERSKLAGWLKSHGVALQNAPLSVPYSELGSLLAATSDHPRVFVGKPGKGMHNPLNVSESAIRPLVRIHISTDEIRSDSAVTLKLEENPAPRLLTLGNGSVWLYHVITGSIHPWKTDLAGEMGRIAKDLLLESQQGKDVLRPINWLPSHLAQMEEWFQVDLDSELQNRYKVASCSPHFSIEVSGSLQEVQLQVFARFLGHEWHITSLRDSFPIQDQQNPLLFYVRNLNAERVLFEHLERLGFQLDGASAKFVLRGNRDIMRFYGAGIPRLTSNYNVTFNSSWIQATGKLTRITPSIKEHNKLQSSGDDWLTMEFAYEAPNGFRISRSDALRLIRSGQNTLKNKDGRQYVLDCDRCEELEEALQDVPVQLSPDGLRVARSHEAYFLPFTSRLDLAATRDMAIDLSAWRDRLGDLAVILRPYQIEGVAWIVQRLKEGQGALLGDDMGLGKTLQSIAAIRCLFSESPGVHQQALVVCPKSLIANWQAEFKKFASDLRVLVVQGANRKELFDRLDAYDVIITSYPLISRDLSLYQSQIFSVGVLDESSFLRNPDTETVAAVKSLRLRSRLALSGTPIENGIRDLWSVFDILLPGYLGKRQSFQERFEKPLESRGDEMNKAAAASRLKRLIRPFFLRRTKQDVLKELPEKIEQVFWCEMSATQAEIYRTILEEGREEIRSARRRSGQNGARMTMLTVLLRLRQVCCDVRLIGLPDNQLSHLDTGELSGKWLAFDGLLDAVIAGGSKVLVFSQFVSYLRACEEYLNRRRIGYAYLDGSTKDRAGQIEAFQNDPLKTAFLISLKAGGYGLNLTQADHVFLMDPWWNPAVEAQAIDRAHRFGQNRVVNAYRLVMRGTVEERVLALQEKKRGLISAAIEERAPMMEGLKDSDLEALLEI